MDNTGIFKNFLMADVTEGKLPKTILLSFVKDFVVSSRVNGSISYYRRKRMTERGKFSPPLVSFPFLIHRLKLVAAIQTLSGFHV